LISLQPHTESVGCLEFGRFDASKLYSSSADGTVRCFDLESCSFQLVYGNPYLHEETTFHHELDAHTFLVAMGSAGGVGLVDKRVSNLKVSNTYRLFGNDSVDTVDVHPINRCEKPSLITFYKSNISLACFL
jgi:WD40 repeat protein